MRRTNHYIICDSCGKRKKVLYEDCTPDGWVEGGYDGSEISVCPKCAEKMKSEILPLFVKFGIGPIMVRARRLDKEIDP